ncbi:XkdQ/YqbQ family protein [Megamonas funiformis]
MLICKYTDPPLTQKEQEELQQKKNNNVAYAEPLSDFDITNFVTKWTWSGDSEQAARKLDFEIVYNTVDKDSAFTALNLKVGGFIYLSYAETEESEPVEIFQGRIFYRKRNSNTFTFSFTCYDYMVYLAKSKVQMLFDGITVTDAIKQVCTEIGINVSANIPQINTVVSFIADGKSCTEVFRMLFEYTKADTTNNQNGEDYTVICLNGDVTVIKKGELIENYIATDLTDIDNSEHSESIESMVNRIKSVDDNGNICQVFTNENDVTHFGMIQDIYKMQPPKENETVDNIKMAKYRLKRLQDESSIKAVGNIQCITGYTIEVQEEQLKGKFFIKSDTHNFSGNVHTMDLTLEYIPDNPQIPEIEQQDIAVPVYVKKALVAVMEVSKLIKDYLQVLMLGVELQWIMGEMGALKLLEKWEAITAHF